MLQAFNSKSLKLSSTELSQTSVVQDLLKLNDYQEVKFNVSVRFRDTYIFKEKYNDGGVYLKIIQVRKIEFHNSSDFNTEINILKS
jgi:hypothetical protein